MIEGTDICFQKALYLDEWRGRFDLLGEQCIHQSIRVL